MHNWEIILLTSSLGSFIWVSIVLASGIPWWYGVGAIPLLTAVAWLGVKE